MSHACPACGAELVFKSRASVFTVCAFCSSTVVRRDVDLESLGKMSQLPPDMSPLQISSRGVWKEAAFEIVGRVKMAWEHGSWNEWYCVFSDARDGWLADGQGRFELHFQQRDVTDLPARSHVIAGKHFEWQGRELVIQDVKEAHCVGSEGELPIQATQGRRGTVADFTGADGEVGTIEYTPADGIRFFLGRPVDLEALRMTGLRELEGW